MPGYFAAAAADPRGGRPRAAQRPLGGDPEVDAGPPLDRSGPAPRPTMRTRSGGIPERSKGRDCKSRGSAFAGSNPAPPIEPAHAAGVCRAPRSRASRAEEVEQRGSGLLGAVLRQEVRGVDRAAADVGRPRTPDLEHAA